MNSITSATVTAFPLPPFSVAPVRDCASKIRLSNSRSPKELSGTSAADSANRKASSCPRAVGGGFARERENETVRGKYGVRDGVDGPVTAVALLLLLFVVWEVAWCVDHGV